MRKGGSKQKGSSFERDVCCRLSKWISCDKQEDVFWRSSMSGGRSTVAHRKGKRLAAQAGDISCIHPMGHALTDAFLLECKHYRDLNFASLLTGKGNLAKFWEVAKTESKRYQKLPMLIAKQNNCPISICLTIEGLKLLNLKQKCILTAPRLNLYLVPFDDFTKHALRPDIAVTQTDKK